MVATLHCVKSKCHGTGSSGALKKLNGQVDHSSQFVYQCVISKMVGKILALQRGINMGGSSNVFVKILLLL